MVQDQEGVFWRIIPLAGATVAALAVGYFLGRYGFPKKGAVGFVNLSQSKDKAKVVHSFNIEEIGEGQYFCRCWRSKKFPYCDGSHNEHNKCTGDNVGPLQVKKSASS